MTVAETGLTLVGVKHTHANTQSHIRQQDWERLYRSDVTLTLLGGSSVVSGLMFSFVSFILEVKKKEKTNSLSQMKNVKILWKYNNTPNYPAKRNTKRFNSTTNKRGGHKHIPHSPTKVLLIIFFFLFLVPQSWVLTFWNKIQTQKVKQKAGFDGTTKNIKFACFVLCH